MILDAEARRRGETRGETSFRIGPVLAAQESQNLRARSQRRLCGFAARPTPAEGGGPEPAANTATRFSSRLLRARRIYYKRSLRPTSAQERIPGRTQWPDRKSVV